MHYTVYFLDIPRMFREGLIYQLQFIGAFSTLMDSESYLNNKTR